MGIIREVPGDLAGHDRDDRQGESGPDVGVLTRQYRVIISRSLRLEEEKWLQGKAAASARTNLITQAQALLESLEQWSSDQVNTPGRKRIMASHHQ